MTADDMLPWWLPMPRETRGLACHHSCCGHRRITDYEGHHHLEPPETCQGCTTRDTEPYD